MSLKRLTPTSTRGWLRLTLLGTLAVLLLIAPSLAGAQAAGNVIRVTVNGATSGTCGSSWATACDLQYALTTVAASGNEVWVAQGVYKPTTSIDRSVSFQLRDGIALYGGFALTETLRDQRNWVANVTTLSGDIGVPGNNVDNSYHVVIGSDVTTTAVLDGFTVTQGYGNGIVAPYDTPYGHGGGMYSENSTATVRNTIFSGNQVRDSGAGMYNANSSPTLINITFSANRASAGIGSGIYNFNSSPTLINVSFSANSAENYGGGMYNDFSSPTISSTIFTDNSAGAYGGGMYNASSNPILTNVTFSANSAFNGGGIYNDNGRPVLINITFNDNSASDGGGMYNINSSPMLTNVTFSANSAYHSGGGAIYNDHSNPTVQNSILWGYPNALVGQIYNISSTLTISDSVVQGGYSGGSNIITADPHLGQLGDYGGGVPTIPLLLGSPAIDAVEAARCPATDQRGIPRPQGAACDLGAFEDRIVLATAVVGSGAVTSRPAGINCPTGLCAMDYAPGTVVTLTATANLGSTFVEWGGACAGAGDCVVVLDNNQSVTATFATKIIHVRPDGQTDVACGSTWANACDLQYALTAVAKPGDELWVARGVYRPTTGTDRNVSFLLRNHIALFGGFALTETMRDQRDWVANVTILSGDIGIPGNNADNSYHVVKGSGVVQTTVLDGFTVSQGNAADSGGGMYNNGGSPTVRNIIFTANSAEWGGGMYNYNARPTLNNVTFNANVAHYGGGGMHNTLSSPTLINVTFTANSSYRGHGGGMDNMSSGLTLINVTFTANSSYYGGGEIYSFRSTGILTNVTVNANLLGTSAGIYNVDSTFTIRNSILWGNIAPMGSGTTLTISDSVVQGGYPGGFHIITADPRLGQLGDYGGGTPTIPLLPGSPAIDAVEATRCPATDQRGIPRPQGAACDLGAFEDRAVLAVTVVGDGMVTSQPAGIDCPTGLCAMERAPKHGCDSDR